MDPGSTLLSADYGASTTGDLSKKLELLESNSQSSNCKSMSSISIANLIGASVSGLKPMETKFENVQENSCQVISIFESDEYDSDEILGLNSLTANEEEEEIPLELEISLLSDDSKGPLLENDLCPSINANLVAPDLYSSTLKASLPLPSSNFDPNNNFSHKKQTLTDSDDGTFLLEDKTKSEQKVCKGVSPKSEVVREIQEFSCAEPSNEIFVESYSTRTNINSYSDLMQNGAILNGNILETTSKSDECESFKDRTIDKKCVWSESLDKSKQKSIDFSKSPFSEISTILKDCNDNVLDLKIGKDILSLEPLDVKKNVETTSDSTKADLHNPQAGLKTQSKENSQQDPCSCQSFSEPCIASQSQDKSGLNPQLDLMEENRQLIQKNSSLSCPMLKSRSSPCFVPDQDFKKLTDNKNGQALPPNLIVFTTLEKNRINILSDNSYTSFQQNHDRSSVQVSPGLKSQPTDNKVLKQTPQNFIQTKSVKWSSQCEDSVIVKDLKDLSKMNKSTVSIPEETSLQHSGNVGVTKSYSLEQSVIKDGKSLTNICDISKMNPGNLLTEPNHERTALTCQNFVYSLSDIPLPNSQNKSIQLNPLSMQKNPLKNNLQDQNSQVDNQFRNSNNKALTSGHSSLNSSTSRQHITEYCPKDKTEESKGSLKSSCAKTFQKMEEEPLLLISVNSDYDNQKRVVKLGNQLKRDEFLATNSNWKQVSKCLNEDNQSVIEKNKYDQELKIKTIQNSCITPCIINKYLLKNIVQPKDISKNSNNNKPVNTDPIPTKCSRQTCNTAISKPIPNTPKNNAMTTLNRSAVSVSNSQLADKKTFKKNKKENQQKTPVQPSKVSKGVKKKKKSKSAKKRTKALFALSQTRNRSAQALVDMVNTQHVSTKCNPLSSNTVTSKPIPNIASSNSSLLQQTYAKNVSVMSEDPMSKRKFVKAKRVWDKQKQLCSLFDGEDCLDECKINDRVQWVCRRWNVRTLSNQDLNLTTAAYIRRQLPPQTAACFQGCLEGQKDYTLAIVAPNRKRKLYQDDNDNTEAADSLGRATKKRRLSRDVQLMPNDIKDLQPNMELFQRQLMEKLSANHSVSLIALKRRRDEKLNMLNEQYHHQHYSLQQQHFQDQLYYGFGSMYQIQCDYSYQHNQLNLALQNEQDHVIKSFSEEERRIRTQYRMNLEKIKTILFEDVSDTTCLTVALRKGPNRMSNYKITYQNVNLTSDVALAIIREDEIYDSFYNHKV